MTTGTDLALRFFTGNGATYDSIASMCTLGLDTLWKKKILELIPEGSKRIVDQACGTGILTFKIAKRFPDAEVIGVELRDEYLIVARQKARALKLSNVDFIVGRAEDIVFEEGSVDCITSSYLAKYVELDRLIANAKAMLKQNGLLIMHELTRPSNPVFVRLWHIQFKFLQTYGAWRYPEWETAFRELPDLLKETKWAEDLTAILNANQFFDIHAESLFLQTAAIITAKNGNWI